MLRDRGLPSRMLSGPLADRREICNHLEQFAEDLTTIVSPREQQLGAANVACSQNRLQWSECYSVDWRVWMFTPHWKWHFECGKMTSGQRCLEHYVFFASIGIKFFMHNNARPRLWEIFLKRMVYSFFHSLLLSVFRTFLVERLDNYNYYRSL